MPHPTAPRGSASPTNDALAAALAAVEVRWPDARPLAAAATFISKTTNKQVFSN